MTIGQTGTTVAGLVLFGLASLSAPGLAGAHGAPDAEGVPEGIVKARITDHPDIQGLSAMILDAPRPGIMFRYKGENPLTVLGMEGEAFLRFTRTEVAVNTNSPSWKALPDRSEMPESGSSDGQASEQTTWMTLSRSGSFGWLDPRLNALQDAHSDGSTQTWSIAIGTADGGTDHVGGRLTFTPLE